MKNLTNSPRIIFENNTHRLTANEQLAQLEQFGLVRLAWQPGQTNHPLATVTLEASRIAPLYALLERQPLAEQRQRLRDLLLGNRFQLDGWRRRAIEPYLHQLKMHKSPAPFSLTDEDLSDRNRVWITTRRNKQLWQ